MMDESFCFSKTIELYRELHQMPGRGFDLDETVSFVKRELSSLKIEYTEQYGRSSIVADLGSGDKILAIRADMDALPIEENTGLPYASRNKGVMHACGHDSHTAVLLSVARYLKSMEDQLACRVRLIFQPSEEGAVSGARMMVENGVMDGVERIICTHCENSSPVGEILVCYGDYMAACIPATLKFFGRSTHAALPQFGIDAIAMAAEAYAEMKAMVAREANGEKYIWSVGKFSGGHVHNVVAESCEMAISFRFYDMDLAKRVEREVRRICADVCEKYGGRFELDWQMSAGPIHNDEDMTADFESIARNSGLNVQKMPQRMSSEDFCWYLEKTPGMIFRFGTRNEEKGCTALAHRSDFRIDEEGMKYAITAFCRYALSYNKE